MVVLNKGKTTEVTLRVVLESDVHGREYSDDYDSTREIIKAVERLVKSACDKAAHDAIERTVSIAIVPKGNYGDESGYGCGLRPDDD
jgi:hypothetical protein